MGCGGGGDGDYLALTSDSIGSCVAISGGGRSDAGLRPRAVERIMGFVYKKYAIMTEMYLLDALNVV